MHYKRAADQFQSPESITEQQSRVSQYMMLASCSWFGLSNASLGAVHAMAHSLRLLDLPHANATLSLGCCG